MNLVIIVPPSFLQDYIRHCSQVRDGDLRDAFITLMSYMRGPRATRARGPHSRYKGILRLRTQAANPDLSNAKAQVQWLSVGSSPSTADFRRSADVAEPKKLGRDVHSRPWGLQIWATAQGLSGKNVNRDRDQQQAFLVVTEFTKCFSNCEPVSFLALKLHPPGMGLSLFFSN